MFLPAGETSRLVVAIAGCAQMIGEIIQSETDKYDFCRKRVCSC